ncbi:MAG: hypothetical protein AB7V00_00360 [Bacilli bacterium]
MEIKERYDELAKRSLSLADFSQIVDLKNQCILALNQEYQYLCDILIIDIYIDNHLFDDALSLALKTFNIIDSVVFQKIYISFLDHIIFIYFQKKNFKSAYRYTFLKRNYLNLEDHDEVNRWYLEMAYIDAELNQKDKASQHLQAILNNYPDESLKALALSNLTKLYLDDGLLNEAKKTLAEGIKLVEKLKDDEGKLYCEYLNAKLFVLEKNFKFAKQSFHDLFHKISHLSESYLGIFNEYLELLITLEHWDDFDRIVAKFYKEVEQSTDLETKKGFYLSLLKAKIGREKGLKEPLKPLLAMLEALDNQVAKNNSEALEISNEDDKNLEINQRLRTLIAKIEKTMVLTNLASLSDNERDCFMEFSKHLETIVNFNEANFIIFSKSNFASLPEFFENFNHVKSFEYKKQRLFERDIPYNNLNGTIVEMVVSANHEIMIDFSNTQLPLKNVVTEKLYHQSLTQSLIAIPMLYEKDLFACAIFTANDSTLLDVDAMALLKVACKLLEFKLISIFYQDSLRTQKNILQIAMNHLQEGIFYLDQVKSRMLCSSQLLSFLKIEEQMIDRNEYQQWIRKEDQNQLLSVIDKIERGESYEITYRINLQNQEIHVKEQAAPYISKEGKIKFYIGTIRKIDENIPISQQKLTMDDELVFNSFLTEIKSKTTDLDYKFALGRFQIINLENTNTEFAMQTIKYFYQLIKQEFSELTFYLADGTFISYLETSDQRIIDRKIRIIFENADRGFRYQNFNINFETKASIVRYPRDSFSVDELIIFSDLALKEPKRYQVFSDDIHKKYLKSSQVAFCLQEQLKKGTIELLYLPLIGKNTIPKSFLVQYNVPGLLPKESVFQYVTNLTIIPFQILALKQLIREINPANDFCYYFQINAKALEMLIKDQFFSSHLSMFQKINLCINDFSENIANSLQYLKENNIKVLVNYHVFQKLHVNDLLNDYLFGVLLEDTLDHLSRQSLIQVCKLYNYELLCNFDFSEFQNVKYKSDILENVAQINQK